MKYYLSIGTMAAALLFSNASLADYTFHSSDANVCEHTTGQWVGTGKATNWFIGECVYHGSGKINPPDNAGKFTLNVMADKDSGSILCPSHTKKQLTGMCANGIVTIMTEYGNMLGNFSENAGDAKGTLSVSPGMNAEVTIQFQRMG